MPDHPAFAIGRRVCDIKRFISGTRNLARLVLADHSDMALQAISRKLRSDLTSIGLRRDLWEKFEHPDAKLPVEVRPLSQSDDLPFLKAVDDSDEEMGRRRYQLRLLGHNLPTCYVAVAPNGDVCYMQWLITATHNEKLQAYFGRWFPWLAADEALLEGAYTPPAYRGLGIMANAMARIAAEAQRFGVRWVLTFVGEENTASIKGCNRAGFLPYVTRHESWRFLRRKVNFMPPAATEQFQGHSASQS